uniref:Uncharacterized protein n=1 Tax=Oryza brachyantha TaxID=4533 RepID=J3MDR5_ORYBR
MCNGRGVTAWATAAGVRRRATGELAWGHDAGRQASMRQGAAASGGREWGSGTGWPSPPGDGTATPGLHLKQKLDFSKQRREKNPASYFLDAK